MTENRVLNIRVMTAVFVGLIVGILFPFLLFTGRMSFSFFVWIAIIITICLIGFWVYAEATRKWNIEHEYRRDVTFLSKSACIGFLLAFIVGICLFVKPFISLVSLKDFGNAEVFVTGEISDYVQSESTYKKFIVDNCVINTPYGEYYTDFKICVYTVNFVDIYLGGKISFTGVLDKFDYYKQSDFSKLIQNIGYSTYITASDFFVEEGHVRVRDYIKDYTKNVLDENMNEDNANISYAILFGEKNGLSEEISNMFSYAGISHILAVSGLHVGVLFSFVYLALKNLHINRYIRIILLGAILLFYTYLCSFTPSVCRASIMAMLTAICDIYRIRCDRLSSLSIAGIIILLFNPFSLFSISFQLSFLCIFAIISFAPFFKKILKKCKVPKFLANSLSVSIATNIAILPVCMNVFPKVSLLGVFTNILILPIFSIAYLLMFSIIVLSFIWKGLAIILFLPEMLLHIIKAIANFVCNIDIGIFRVFSISYWILFFIFILALIIHFLMVNNVLKSSLAIVVLIIIIPMFVYSYLPAEYSGNNLLFATQYKSNVCYYVKDDNVTIIGSDIDCENVILSMKKLKVNKIDTIIAYDLQLNNLDELNKIIEEYKVKNIYIHNKFEYSEIEDLYGCEFFKNDITLKDMKFNAIEYNDQIIGVYLEIDDIGEVLIPEINPTKAESKYLIDNYSNVDFIYINNDNIKIDLEEINPRYIITNENCLSGDISLEKYEIFVLNKDCEVNI